jgi:hypothetical protein
MRLKIADAANFVTRLVIFGERDAIMDGNLQASSS